jgi:beta-lactam-binding protein with PASTA domain
MSEAQARQALASIPVTIKTPSPTATSKTIPQGDVISVDPQSGTAVKRGSTVTLTVSSGLPSVDIPPLQQQTGFDQEQQTLSDLGFKVNQVEDFSTDVAQGDVISVDPSDSASYGATITVDVSKGPQLVNVPPITPQMPLSQAEQMLTEANLQYDVKTFDGATGTVVLAISPNAGTSVQVGSTVTIYAL